MCDNFPNIRITEGNNFSLVLPLRSRTYVATKPIDEDIDPEQLENVVVTFGGVEYPAQRTAQGVQIDLPATLAVGTYNILLTADYLESKIRAAYESAVTIVPWSAQSTAEQYIAGSPIVMRAAYVLSCVLTDAELEALKQECREKIAEAEQAKEEAEQAKAEWEQKAAELDGVAQEATLTQGVQDIRGDISHIDIDTDDLAKQGADPTATNTAIMQAVLQAEGQDAGVALFAQKFRDLGLDIPQNVTLVQLFDYVDAFTTLLLGNNKIAQGITIPATIIGAIAAKDIFEVVKDEYAGGIPFYSNTGFFQKAKRLKEVYLNKTPVLEQSAFTSCTALRIIEAEDTTLFGPYVFSGCSVLQVLKIPKCKSITDLMLRECSNLIDLTIGGMFESGVSFTNGMYSPTNAWRTDTNSLCYDTDQEKYGQIFSTNFDKWKWCIINHFAANLQDRTGLSAFTITFGSTVLSHFDAEMIAAFTDKNWNLA